MENNKNEDDVVRLNKIPLGIFIQTLQDIYDMGIDFVDIVGINNVDQDVLSIHYNNTYIAKYENEVNNDTEVKVNLTDDNLNDLT